ncbi:MAG: hypothetical protein DRJ65_16065 [Acidobacteria bacterium]|nr:MAG: hypothetical protein DRJ65_16065 [Acidobacteriota bacterium]
MRSNRVHFALLLSIMVLAAGLRLVGVNWDQGHHLHPDERFMGMVADSLEPVDSLGEYLDTAHSTLNPKNVGGQVDFVYGTFPAIAVRLLSELTGHKQSGQVYLLGRMCSAVCDLGVLLLVYLIATSSYDRRVGLLAAAMSAVVVLQIQQSHYFTVDNFANLFVILAIFAATRIASCTVSVSQTGDGSVAAAVRAALAQSDARFAALFAFAAAAAVAAKLNAAPVVFLLPFAYALQVAGVAPNERAKAVRRALLWMTFAASLSFLVFRLLHPYVFAGPGLFGIKFNPQWVTTIRALLLQTGADADWPPAMQWARRSIFFSGRNMVLWGFGPALGALAWFGFAGAGWRIIHGRWRRHAVLWGWVAFYFTWQSLAHNPTMRYQLPVYPVLTVFAAWAVIALWDHGRRTTAVLTGAIVLAVTTAWAVAFTGIYTRPVTRVEASHWILQNATGPINVLIDTAAGGYQQVLRFPYDGMIAPEKPYSERLVAAVSGSVSTIVLPHVLDLGGADEEPVLAVTLTREGEEGRGATTPVYARWADDVDSRGRACRFTLIQPYELDRGAVYTLQLNVDRGALRLSGSSIANETGWDDGLPLRVAGHDPYGGIYEPDLKFEMYWDDNEQKRERFVDTLDRADFVVISSSRQWASLPRLPERFPLTTAYYRDLLGCPPELEVEQCYNRAQLGLFEGRLGFDLLQVFESPPTLGPIRCNDQLAEEAFTVYDHPKVFVFGKSAAYNSNSVRERLGAIDLSRVVRVVPGLAGNQPADLMLPPDRLARLRAGGTWSDLFDRSSFVNRWQPMTVFLWYLMVAAVGVVSFPLVRLALPGLPDRGWALSRIAGLLTIAYLVWLLGSLQIAVTRTTITAVVAALAVASAVAGWRHRDQLASWWRDNRRYLIYVETVFAVLFLIGILVRFGNPDLWHPHMGGEKPMDFSYFNAVLKSTTFPPYDPWFAGGYLNYYYWGFVLVGVPVKWLGIVPAVAYNLILPTLLAVIGAGAFSIAWNLMVATRADAPSLTKTRRRPSPESVGVAAALAMAVIGNLGTIPMVVEGLQRLAAPGPTAGAGLLTRLWWIVKGSVKFLGDGRMPFGIGEWYWNPTRIIPDPSGSPITEFPAFTFLFADLHAHYLDLSVTLLVIAWAASMVLGWRRWKQGEITRLNMLAAVLLGGLAVGSLRAINTWSYFPFLVLVAVALGYARWRSFTVRSPSDLGLRVVATLASVAALVAVARLSFQPYASWYGQGYGQIDWWTGFKTPLGAYLTHWGLFLFIIVSWIVWEILSWMASTPVSALRVLVPYRAVMLAAVAVLVAAMVGLQVWGVTVAWLVCPVVVLAGLLLLRSGLPEAKRLVLFLVGTGLMLTLMVELVVVRGDIGRMNTVFKFYLQAWTLLAVSAAAAFGWLFESLPARPRRSGRVAWLLVLFLLVVSAGLYPVIAGTAKVRDRMSPNAPHTLDGMAYMDHASYQDQGSSLELAEDARAIRWMQDNVAGSPVIVEANTPEYRWGSRFTIYTGLPGVVGWNWHQRQQRALTPHSWVWDRVNGIAAFFETVDGDDARAFLRRYDVRYIVVGQLEHAYYAGPGLDKFPALEGDLWRRVYLDGATSIYEVINTHRSKGAPVAPQ